VEEQVSAGEGTRGVPTQSTLILIIDDSPTIRKIVETGLRREGFEVISFPDGVEALTWLASPQGRLPGLILLDVNMPKMDGYEVARHLKARPHYKNIVIVMLTRRDGIMDRLKSRLAGAEDYLTKPFKTQDLLAVVTTRLGVQTNERV
jgi:DNA-binding response OmpR family regulator